MKKGKLIGKIFAIALVFAMIGGMLGGLPNNITGAATFNIGDTVEVTENLNVRTGPGITYPEISDPDYIGYAPAGTRGKVLAGPISADGYTWWRVDYGPELYLGWSVEGGLKKVNLPDLIVEDIWTDPVEFKPGAAVKVYIRIKNRGDGDAISYQGLYIKGYFDESLRYEEGIEGLGAGWDTGNALYWTQTWPSDTNTHTITARVDPDNFIPESEEGNNELSEQFAAKANQAPSCSVTANPTSGQAPLTVTFTMSASDSDGSISAWVLDVNGDGNADYSGTGNPPSTKTHTYTTPSPTSGYSVVLMVSDNNGATAFDTETVVVGANSPPTCSVSASPSSGPAPLSVTFTMSASDSDGWIESWALDVNFDGVVEYSGSGYPPSTKTHTYSTPDSYTAILIVSDDKDATASDSEIINVSSSDTVKPTISITSPSSGQTFTASTITVYGTASDNVGVSKVEVKVGAGSWELASGTTSWSKQVTLSSGSNTIYAKATDTSGNPSSQVSVTVTYSPPDTTPPTVSIVSPNNGQSFNVATITVSGTASDNVGVSKVEVKVGAGSWGLASGTTSWSKQVTLSAGSNIIYAKATDSSGNTKETSVTAAYGPAEVGHIVLVEPLQIAPGDPYFVSDYLTATFRVKNVGNAEITLDKLLLGGRYNDGELPGGGYPDFTYQTVTLQPGESHPYEGTLELTEAGDYHFFCAYQTPDGQWNPSIDLGPGLTDEDRVEDITVEFPSGSYISRIIPDSGVAGQEVIIKGVNFPELHFVDEKFAATVRFGDYGFGEITSFAEIISYSTSEIICLVPGTRDPRPGDNPVEVALYDKGQNYRISNNVVTFTYKRPSLDSLSRSSGIPGTTMTLYGENFGHKQYRWDHVSFGASRSDRVVGVPYVHPEVEITKWGNTDIEVVVPDDYGLGLGPAKDAFNLLTLAATLGSGSLFKKAFALLTSFIPDLVEIEVEFKEDEPLWSLWAKIALAIGAEEIPGLNVNLAGEITVPVIVTAGAGESNALVFTFKVKEAAPIDIEPSLIAHLASPGELRVYDSQGRITGLVSGEPREEIPNSAYFDSTVFVRAPSDSYCYEVVGTGEGTYGLGIASIEYAEAVVFTAADIPTTDKTVHNYTIDWDALSEGEEGVTVYVDSDGDGVFEHEFTSDEELTGDDFVPSSQFPWCFIATAAYGTPVAEEIQILRDFRDEYLMTNPVGRGLVEFYYEVSPPIAQFITEHPSLKSIVRVGLLPAVAMSTVAVNTTPVEKTAIVSLLALVSVAVAVWATRRRVRSPEYMRW